MDFRGHDVLYLCRATEPIPVPERDYICVKRSGYGGIYLCQGESVRTSRGPRKGETGAIEGYGWVFMI